MEMEQTTCQFCSTNLNEAEEYLETGKVDMTESSGTKDDFDFQPNEEDINTQDFETALNMDLEDKLVDRPKRQSDSPEAIPRDQTRIVKKFSQLINSDAKIKLIEEKLNNIERELTQSQSQSSIQLEKTERALNDKVSRIENQMVGLMKTYEGIQEQLKTHSSSPESTNETNKELQSIKTQLDLLSTKHPSTFEWKITNWEENMKNAKASINPTRYSAEFYTSYHGYKMKAWICPNGFSTWKGTHMSLALMLVPGKYDETVSWSFSQKVKFTLLNQTGGADYSKTFDPVRPNSDEFRETDSITRPEGTTYSFGFSQFISHEQLNRGQFIKNDTVHLTFEFEK